MKGSRHVAHGAQVLAFVLATCVPGVREVAVVEAHDVTPTSQEQTGTFRVTAYCLDGRTRSGEWTRPGVVAVDPSVIPLGSWVAIEGLGDGFQALDTGGGVRGNHVDVWFASCAAALNWGVRYRDVSWSVP